jgi:hypothetical protein
VARLRIARVNGHAPRDKTRQNQAKPENQRKPEKTEKTRKTRDGKPAENQKTRKPGKPRKATGKPGTVTNFPSRLTGELVTCPWFGPGLWFVGLWFGFVLVCAWFAWFALVCLVCAWFAWFAPGLLLVCSLVCSWFGSVWVGMVRLALGATGLRATS